MSPEKSDLSELDQATEDLNEGLLQAESALRSRNLGVSAGITFLHNSRICMLYFKKRGDEWCFIVSGPDVPETHLLSASRSLRVEAAAHLRELYKAMVSEEQNQLEVVNKAIKDVYNFIGDVNANNLDFGRLWPPDLRNP